MDFGKLMESRMFQLLLVGTVLAMLYYWYTNKRQDMVVSTALNPIVHSSPAKVDSFIGTAKAEVEGNFLTSDKYDKNFNELVPQAQADALAAAFDTPVVGKTQMKPKNYDLLRPQIDVPVTQISPGNLASAALM